MSCISYVQVPMWGNTNPKAKKLLGVHVLLQLSHYSDSENYTIGLSYRNTNFTQGNGDGVSYEGSRGNHVECETWCDILCDCHIRTHWIFYFHRLGQVVSWCIDYFAFSYQGFLKILGHNTSKNPQDPLILERLFFLSWCASVKGWIWKPENLYIKIEEEPHPWVRP